MNDGKVLRVSFILGESEERNDTGKQRLGSKPKIHGRRNKKKVNQVRERSKDKNAGHW